MRLSDLKKRKTFGALILEFLTSCDPKPWEEKITTLAVCGGGHIHFFAVCSLEPPVRAQNYLQTCLNFGRLINFEGDLNDSNCNIEVPKITEEDSGGI